MFSRVLSKGFFRQGFPGWYRGKFSEAVPSNPGTFTLGYSVAGLAMDYAVASMALTFSTAEFMLDGETAGFELETMTPTFTLERQF